MARTAKQLARLLVVSHSEVIARSVVSVVAHPMSMQ